MDIFVIYSNTSRNGMAGLRPKVILTCEKDIVDAAAQEMRFSGETLEDMAGINWIEDSDGNFQPQRVLTDEEVLDLSIQKLGDDGRLYRTFRSAAAFIEAAECHGLEDEARNIVEGV